MHQKQSYRSAVQSGFFNILRLISLQSLLVVFIAIAWGFHGFDFLWSTLFGGAVCILPAAFFAAQFFASGRKHTNPNKIVNSFYLGELLKLIITAGLALLVLVSLPVQLFPFLSGFVGATMGIWLMPLFRLLVKRDVRVAQ